MLKKERASSSIFISHHIARISVCLKHVFGNGHATAEANSTSNHIRRAFFMRQRNVFSKSKTIVARLYQID